VPAPVTRAGQNEVIVIELEQMLVDAARFAAGPLLGPEEE
jgi:beta-galactosidase